MALYLTAAHMRFIGILWKKYPFWTVWNAAEPTQLARHNGGKHKEALGQPAIFSLLVYHVCSYFLTVWNGMNKGKLQRLTPTGLKENMKAEHKQIHSVCTEFIFSLHVTAFKHWNQMRNNMLLQAQENTVVLQSSKQFHHLVHLCKDKPTAFSLPEGQSSCPFCSTTAQPCWENQVRKHDGGQCRTLTLIKSSVRHRLKSFQFF